MPHVERKVAEAYDVPVRKTRRHWFGGSLIPKKPEFTAELEPLLAVFGDGIDVTLVAGESDAKPLEISALAQKDQKLAKARTITCQGSCQTVSLNVENIAGHRMPSGDPERHVDLALAAHAEDGEVISKVWFRLSSRYEWWPKIELQADTRLMPGETRSLRLEVPAETAYVTLLGEKFRMYEDAFDYHELEGQYVRGRKFLDKRWVFEDGQPVQDQGNRQ